MLAFFAHGTGAMKVLRPQFFLYTSAIYIKFRCYGAAGMATMETAPMQQQLSFYACTKWQLLFFNSDSLLACVYS